MVREEGIPLQYLLRSPVCDKCSSVTGFVFGWRLGKLVVPSPAVCAMNSPSVALQAMGSILRLYYAAAKNGTRSSSPLPPVTKKTALQRPLVLVPRGGLMSLAQDCVPILRIAPLRFAPSNLFARSLRSLGVLVPRWTQKRPQKCGLIFFGAQGGIDEPCSGLRPNASHCPSPLRSVKPLCSIASLTRGSRPLIWAQKRPHFAVFFILVPRGGLGLG